MKNIRNTLYGAALMYKTSIDVNPYLTTISTVIVAFFAYSVAKIFGL